MAYKVGVVYERYGYILVDDNEASTEEEAVKAAQKKLDDMSVAELEAMTSYFVGSEELDTEGVLTV